MAGLRIGVPLEFFAAGLDVEVEAAVRTALKEYEKRGATLVDVSLPHSPYALASVLHRGPCRGFKQFGPVRTACITGTARQKKTPT